MRSGSRGSYGITTYEDNVHVNSLVVYLLVDDP